MPSPYPHQDILASKLVQEKGNRIDLWDKDSQDYLFSNCSTVEVEVCVWNENGIIGRFEASVYSAFRLIQKFPRYLTVEIRY